MNAITRLLGRDSAAACEFCAQQVATHWLAKDWQLESIAPWTFGFPSAAIETRAREILQELRAE